MNRSFSKIRHIQETNKKLELRLLQEQGLDTDNPNEMKKLGLNEIPKQLKSFFDSLDIETFGYYESIKPNADGEKDYIVRIGSTVPNSMFSEFELNLSDIDQYNRVYDEMRIKEGKGVLNLQSSLGKRIYSFVPRKENLKQI
jgi:hypothetical protein